MRYLLIDHVTDYHSGGFIRGVKNITMSEDFLAFHFPKNPVMPGALLLEALVQLSGWLEAKSSDFRRWVLLRRITKAAFYGFALPGDQVLLEVQAQGVSISGVNTYKGTGHVGGKKKVTAIFEVDIVPLSRIGEAHELAHLFRILTRDSGFSKDE